MEPASREQAAAVVSAVEAQTSADMNADSIGALARMVMRRGYTEAELAYAMEELMYDPQLEKELSFREGNDLRPADFERVISRHREMRNRLDQLLTRWEMNKLINDYPQHLSRDDFGVAGFTTDDEALYRFKNDPDTPNGVANPKLSDRLPGADRERDPMAGEHGHEPVTLNEALNPSTDDASESTTHD